MNESNRRRVTLPATTRYLAPLRAATAIALEEAGADEACARDLVLAADELAAVIVGAAREDGALELAIDHDEDDCYIRLSAPMSPHGFAPSTPELTERLLAATTASFEVRIDDAILHGVLQRPRVTTAGGS